MFYVYNLIDPRSNSIFYVGKGKGNRMYRHERYTLNNKYPNGNKLLYEKIKDIKDNNFEVIYKKVYETEDEFLAYEVENKIINEIGIENLCNVICDKVLIGIASNTKDSNWYYNANNDEYRLIKGDVPDGFVKGSPRTTDAMKKWWQNLSDEELNEYKIKMSNSLKNSEKHKLKVSSEEYKANLSKALKNSESFNNYNKNRTKRGKYKESQKSKNRRKSSILVDTHNNIIKEFDSLADVCEYFDIKISTASIWIKVEKKIDNLILKSK